MLSSNLQMLLVAGGIIIGVVGSLGIGFPYLKKKGINATGVLNTVENGLQEADIAIKAAKELAPSKALNTLDIIDNLAQRGTKAAQQLAISSQLPLEKRKAQANQSILSGLKAFDIPVTPEIQQLINDSIEQYVIDSKTPEEQKGQAQNTLQQQKTALQTTINQLSTDKVTLQQQVTDLQNKLNTIQATVTPVVVSE